MGKPGQRLHLLPMAERLMRCLELEVPFLSYPYQIEWAIHFKC